jgi:solute carrier family 25 S-adenosylmethionine transporter 26
MCCPTTTVATSSRTVTSVSLLQGKRNTKAADSRWRSSAASRTTLSRPLLNNDKKDVPILAKPFSKAWWWYHVRVGWSGGIAGAVGTTLLYPIDSAKTLRQANPEQFSSVWAALWSSRQWYRGVVPAAIGAIPASALYFGVYEAMKSLLLQVQVQRQPAHQPPTVASRLLLHASAAASGNILSSMIFVPKEFIKQQLQYGSSTSIQHCVAQHGLRGLYRGYQATLLRNIPSAALRFVLYEELKYALYTSRGEDAVGSWRLFAAGAVSGALASGFLTPMDVLKTRMSVGQCPVDLPGCFHHVLDTAGWTALYAGAGSRMLFSGLFSAAGFGTFETVKRWMKVSSRTTVRE